MGDAMIDDVAGDERNRHFCMHPFKMSSSNRLGSSGFIYLSFIVVLSIVGAR